jgi:hypothetical protein
VVSTIQGLRVIEVRLVNQGTLQAAIEIEVTNDRDLAVMGLDFIWRHGSDSGGIAIDGLLEEDNPRTVIPAHGTENFEWELSGILEGETVFLAAAIFEDGMEVGDRQSLAGIRKSRAQYQLEVQTRNRRPQ